MSETETLWAQYEPRYSELIARPLSTENVSAWLHDWSELTKTVKEAAAAALRAKNENTEDEVAETAYLQFVREVKPHVEKADQAMKLKVLALGTFSPNEEQTQFVRRFRNEADLFREANVPLFAEEKALSSKYNKLMGTLTVTLDARTLTLPQAEQRLLEPDREVRERAFRTINETKLSIGHELNALFLELLALRRKIAANAGLSYRDFRWRDLNRFDYSPEDCYTFHEAIANEAIPLLTEIREERRRELNLPSLRPWDLQVDPQARAALKPFDSVTALEEGIAHLFNRLHVELGEQFSSLRNGWLDLESRRGKVPGLGYQSFFPKSRKPYIYHSFNGSHRDVIVLVHEAGHAFHSLASSAQNDLFWNVPTGEEFAEVASQTMELLTLPYLSEDEGGFYTRKDATRAKQEGLDRVLGALPRLAQADAFQHWLYADAPEDVSIEEIDGKWLELSERFSPGIDWSGLEHIQAKGWQYFHIYAVPFYMLEYAFAWLGAVQIWQNALADPRTALKQYREALALGGTRPLPELFEAAGARFAFDRETVGRLMRFVYEQR